MKKIVLVSSLIASILVMAACAKNTPEQNAQVTPAASHDYKGEVSKKK